MPTQNAGNSLSVIALFPEYFTNSTFNNVVRSKVIIFFILHEYIRSFIRNFDEFHSFASELSRAADVLPTLAVMFRDTLAFIHTVLINQEAASLCLSEIVTHQHMCPICQCVMHFMSLMW